MAQPNTLLCPLRGSSISSRRLSTSGSRRGRWRDLEASGVVPRVVIPLPNGRELRKLLFDRADLDRLIESWKLSLGSSRP